MSNPTIYMKDHPYIENNYNFLDFKVGDLISFQHFNFGYGIPNENLVVILYAIILNINWKLKEADICIITGREYLNDDYKKNNFIKKNIPLVWLKKV